MHIHALKDDREAKFWLWPEIAVAYNDGLDARTLRQLMNIVANRRDEITGAWNEFFDDAD